MLVIVWLAGWLCGTVGVGWPYQNVWLALGQQSAGWLARSGTYRTGSAAMTAPGHPDIGTAADLFLGNRRVAYTEGLIVKAHA